MLPSAQCGLASSGHPAHLLPVEFCLITVSVYLFFHSLSSACFLKFCPAGLAALVLRLPSPRRSKAKPRGRRGAGVKKKASYKQANGGLRGAFRPWYKGPPAAFLSTFRRWKVDAVLRARRRGSFRASRSIITGSPFLSDTYNPSVSAYGPASSPFRSRAFLRKRHCGTAKRAARDLTGGPMFLP